MKKIVFLCEINKTSKLPFFEDCYSELSFLIFDIKFAVGDNFFF